MSNKHIRPSTIEDHKDGTYSVVTHQDVGPTLEANKDMERSYGSKLTPGKQASGTRVASIPFTVWEQWMKDTNGAIERDSKLLAKYLNDSDNKYFRTTPTRV